MQKFLIPIFSLTIFSLIFLPFFVSDAKVLVPCGEKGNPCTVCHLFSGTQGLINFLLKDVAFPLAIVAFLYGGVMWIIAAGDEGKIKKGQTAIKYAIYGILFAFAAWILVDTIIKYLVVGGFKFAFGPWNAVPICNK